MDGRVVRTGYAGGRPQEPPDGGIAVAMRTLHHLPHELPNGNFLALSGFGRFARDWRASYVVPETVQADRRIVGDEVVEFSPDAEIVWRWNRFDHRDVNRTG